MSEPVYDRIGGGYTGGGGRSRGSRRGWPGRWATRTAWSTWALALIGDTEREAGMARLSGDLASGEWRRKNGYLLELDELDLGYRVIVAGSR